MSKMILWLLSLFVVACLAAQCGCGMLASRGPLLTQWEYSTVVHIEAACLDMYTGDMREWSGSGVIVKPHTVLTAAHVANVPLGSICKFAGKTADGLVFELAPMTVVLAEDLAAMRADRDLLRMSYPEVGEALKLGDTVCSAYAVPRPGSRCGRIDLPFVENGIRIGVETSMMADAGNSGSPVFDELGRLVGIVTKMTVCSNTQICGSIIGELNGRISELLAQ